MATAMCELFPKVKNTNKESRLFKNLLTFSNDRNFAADVYSRITHSDFPNTSLYSRLVLDDLNEPTIYSLWKETDISDTITEHKIKSLLIKFAGGYNDDGILKTFTKTEANNLKEKIENVNNNKNPFLNEFKLVLTKRDKGFILDVEKRKNPVNNTKTAFGYNDTLNSILKDKLSNWGISVGALTELEERLEINGVTDFETAKTSAEGLMELIRIAKGIEGEKALPEEFAHFVIRGLQNEPLIQRLVKALSTNDIKNIIGSEYDSYYDEYEGNEFKLREEAAGKLLAKHLLRHESIPENSYRNILQRAIEYIKRFFSKFNLFSIKEDIINLDSEYGRLAKDLLLGKYDNKVKLNKVHTSDKFYSLEKGVKRNHELLKKIISTEVKRYAIYEKRTKNTEFKKTQETFVDSLVESLNNKNEVQGIYDFLSNAIIKLKEVSIKLENLSKDNSTALNIKAKTLRDSRNYIFSYSTMIQEIRNYISEENKKDAPEIEKEHLDKFKDYTTNLLGLIADLNSDYESLAFPLFKDFLEMYVDKEWTISFGKDKGKKMSVEQLLKEAESDISFFDRWLDSMAESSSELLKIIDHVVKSNKEVARLDTIDVVHDILSMGTKLEQAGIKNTEWMYARDSEGNLTGEYISEDEINSNKYNDAQKEFYNSIIKLKETLDGYLPGSATTLLNSVKVRKDLVERLQNSKNIKDASVNIWESFKDLLIRRGDDTDIEEKTSLIDFEGKEVKTLPIYFTGIGQDENLEDYSFDVVSSMIAYASMAIDYREMNKIVDILEVGNTILENPESYKIYENEGEKQLIGKVSALGYDIKSKLYKTGGSRRIVERLKDYYSMELYKEYMKDEGTVLNTKIDTAKAANFLNSTTALNNMALNLLSGVSNVVVGDIMIRIESLFAKEFFSTKDVTEADLVYGKNLFDFLGEMNSRTKTSKLYLWNELFNVGQDYEGKLKEVNFDRKQWYKRMISTSPLFFFNNCGEHWLQTRTSLALSNQYKMKSPSGNIVSLWEAMEVVYKDSNNKSLGATLKVKEGYTKEDGTAFTRQDIIKFTLKVKGLNQRMHGIYNKSDRNAIQRLAIGRLCMMYRKWIVPSMNRRFAKAGKNYDLDINTEGYYRTSFRFIKTLYQDLKKNELQIMSRFDELEDFEKMNIKRALTEVGIFIGILILIKLIEWNDDKERFWPARLAEYQLKRTYTELGALIPNPAMLSEGLKILKEPAAGINTIESLLDLTKLVFPSSWFDKLESGRYKGHSHAYKTLMQSPLFPMNKTIYKVIHPEELIPYYDQ